MLTYRGTHGFHPDTPSPRQSESNEGVMLSEHPDSSPFTPTVLDAAGVANQLKRLTSHGAAALLIDTETLGLGGMPFLIQLEDLDTGTPLIIRVRDHAPSPILELLEALAHPLLTLVGHNLTFDLAKLSHLATVCRALVEAGQDWSEEAVWNAERIWRPGQCSFEERLKQLWLLWPRQCVDTLVAAHRLPPFANEPQSKSTIAFTQIPAAAVPRLFEKFKENLNQDQGGIEAHWRLGDRLSWAWNDKPHRHEKARREAAIKSHDYRVLADVRFTLNYPGAYSLKTLAPLLGYDGPAEHQDFEGVFGRAEESCPVWTERGGPQAREVGHADAWAKSLELEHDESFLSYAAADIAMLRVVYDHYRQQPGFDALGHDMALVPWAAAVRLTGIHVDEAERDRAAKSYEAARDDGIAHCQALGLANIKSSDQVVEFVNKHVVKRANTALPVEEDDLEEVEDSRRQDTLEPLLKQLETLKGADDARLNLRMLIQARVFDKKLQFVRNIHGDSVFPMFHITGTETDRMTCTNPNSQQMPSPDRETDLERAQDLHFRAMFSSPNGWKMRTGDFDQLELRLKSGVTRDPFTQAIYARETNEDPADEHSETALKIFNAELHAVVPGATDAELLCLLKSKDKRVKAFRGKAKPVGFGIAYGASEFGISRSAGCSVEEARRILDQYWRVCPATKAAIHATHEMFAILRDAGGWGIQVGNPKALGITNPVGVSRYFRIALRMIRIAGLMANAARDVNGRSYLEREIMGPGAALAQVQRGTDRMTGGARTVTAVGALRSALRGGAFALQGKVQRRSFNFLIQSFGSYLTKRLQGEVYALIQPGLWRAEDLPVLPGLQVHDEIHQYTRGDQDARIHEIVERFRAEASRLVGCPIRFVFEEVRSWAEK